ncbi:MAG: hypothetical protein A2Z37_02020 [Chloroflexi bacterium RBG_19FT_COMBO_62_14]|nr:MAG: hypothetical protein A2Z37_02020 [Chloroflexi bacterium RBG_19FT_COMBO_62_14]
MSLWTFRPPNNSLERTQPQREFMYDVAVLRRSPCRTQGRQLEAVRQLECPREGKNETCRLLVNLVDTLRIM